MMTFGGGGKILDMQIFNHEWTDSVRTEIFMGILSKIAQITSDQLITSRKLSGNFQMLYQLLPAWKGQHNRVARARVRKSQHSFKDALWRAEATL